jgi:hypothetical protein
LETTPFDIARGVLRFWAKEAHPQLLDHPGDLDDRVVRGDPASESSRPAAAAGRVDAGPCPSLQQNPLTDWMYTADAGGCGQGSWTAG